MKIARHYLRVSTAEQHVSVTFRDVVQLRTVLGVTPFRADVAEHRSSLTVGTTHSSTSLGSTQASY